MTTPIPLKPAESPASLTRLLGYLIGDADNERLRADIFDLALTTGDLEVAQQQATWLLSRRPADYAWRHRLVLLDMARGEWEGAKLVLQSLVAEGQTSPVLTYNLAYIDYAQGRVAQAIERLLPLFEEGALPFAEALTLMLRCLHVAGRVDDGVTLFERHLANEPSSSAWGCASLLALDAGRTKMAIYWADIALSRGNQQREALVAKGTALLARRETSGALQNLRAALLQQPEDGRTLSAIGMAHLLSLDIEPALQAFQRAIDVMPSHIGTWHGIGWCQILRHDLLLARKAFESALALDRNFDESHGAMAILLAMEGRVLEAEDAIRRAQKLNPSCLSARYAQAVLSGDTKDAARFSRIARAALSQRRDADGTSLADVVLRQG